MQPLYTHLEALEGRNRLPEELEHGAALPPQQIPGIARRLLQKGGSPAARTRPRTSAKAQARVWRVCAVAVRDARAQGARVGFMGAGARHRPGAVLLAFLLGRSLLQLPSTTAFSCAPLRPPACSTSIPGVCLRNPSRGTFSPARRNPVQRAFKRSPLQRQGTVAATANMGILRVLTPETIPVDCSEPVDPKALATAQAVIKSLRFACSLAHSERSLFCD